MRYYEEDLFEMSKDEFCKAYNITSPEYDMVVKEFQEM